MAEAVPANQRCGSTASQIIDAPTLRRWLGDAEASPGDRDSLMLIDVREPVEYASEHIPGAISHPLSQLDPSQIKLQPGQQLVVYCQSGKRSARAVEQLKAAGFPRSFNCKAALHPGKPKPIR